MKPFSRHSSRDRKRSLHEIAEGIRQYRLREDLKRTKRVEQVLRVGGITIYLLAFINLLLMIDVYLVPHQACFDEIKESNTVHGKRGQTSNFNIQTTSGRFWTITNTGYETLGTRIRYNQTRLFKIAYKIVNLDRHYQICRSYDAFLMAKAWSIIFFSIGVLGILSKRIRSHEIYAGMIIGITIGEILLLIY